MTYFEGNMEHVLMKWGKIQLAEDEICAIQTMDGVLIASRVHQAGDELKHADMIQEWMCYIMKMPEHKEGLWAWYIKKDGTEVLGVNLE